MTLTRVPGGFTRPGLITSPDPLGPGSGPDRRGGSEGPVQEGQDRTPSKQVQVQVLNGPDLGARPGPDLDRAYFVLYVNATVKYVLLT